jgi:phytoene synthase
MDDRFAHCADLVRTADRDRFLTALFAPEAERPALLALYAFNIEIARVREVAREPLAGEIRLQWWTDLLAGEVRGEAAAHPVAAALLATKARHGLSDAPLREMIEARRFDLYNAPMSTLAELESYGRGTASSLIALAAQILAPGADVAALAEHAGLAYAITGLLAAFPMHAARGQLYLPLDMLQRHGAGPPDALGGRATPGLRAAMAELRGEARRHLAAAGKAFAAAPPKIAPALLPLALVRPMLERMQRPDNDPFVPVEIAPWRRQWRLWRAARRPERMFG